MQPVPMAPHGTVRTQRRISVNSPATRPLQALILPARDAKLDGNDWPLSHPLLEMASVCLFH